jgi:pectinesterase
MYATLAFVLSLAATVAAAPAEHVPRDGPIARTSAPAGCLAVGGSGKYKTVQSAVDALSKSTSNAQCIFIAQGTYKEQVYIQQLQSPLTIYGETKDARSYSGNTVTITQGKSQANSANNDETATLRAHTTNLKVYNINLVNTRGKGDVALALSAWADKQGYYGCMFKGYQDTLLAQIGNQIYAKSYIEGATDFIWGQQARAWFDGCTIGVLGAEYGWITANGRDSDSNPSYYVINKSKVTNAVGATVAAGAFYLGRPWRNYARVVFQETNLSNIVNPQGWSIWNTGDDRTDHVSYGEYKNTGDGAKTKRSFGKILSAAVSISEVLGSDYKNWVDGSYLS